MCAFSIQASERGGPITVAPPGAGGRHDHGLEHGDGGLETPGRGVSCTEEQKAQMSLVALAVPGYYFSMSVHAGSLYGSKNSDYSCRYDVELSQQEICSCRQLVANLLSLIHI